MRYLIAVDTGLPSFGACVPALPGCIAVGSTREDAPASIHEAIGFHLEGRQEVGQPVAPPPSATELVDVAWPGVQNGRPACGSSCP
jgi:predicted RNase H-like HicB family nuclease